MSVSSGSWYEDPKAFLTLYWQCRGSEDNAQLARSFIYYLEVNSLADEWLEKLPEEDRKSWASIVVLFQRKWLNKEISIKWPTTPKNKPQPAPTTLQIITEDLYYKTNPLKTPKFNAEHDKSQDVTTTPSTTTINQLDLKPPHSPNPTQNPCPNTSEQPPAAPRVFMNPQTSQTMPTDGSTTFKKIIKSFTTPSPPAPKLWPQMTIKQCTKMPRPLHRFQAPSMSSTTFSKPVKCKKTG